MLDKKTIARPYAQAAFEQAQEENALSEWSEALAVVATMTQDPQMQNLIHDPRVTTESLQSFVIDLLGDSLSKTMQNFVKLLIESDRLSLGSEISRLFDERKAETEKHAHVHVVSAYEMDDAEKQKISETMNKQLGCSIDVSSEIDPTLIGGMIIRAGDMVIDLSVRGRLDTMANEFK